MKTNHLNTINKRSLDRIMEWFTVHRQLVRVPDRGVWVDLGSRPRSLVHVDLNFPTLWSAMPIPLLTFGSFR